MAAKPKTAKEVQAIIKRFLRTIEDWEREIADNGGNTYWPSKCHAAMLRASMDLTRVLAKLRRGE
jgi:hypothetical protein